MAPAVRQQIAAFPPVIAEKNALVLPRVDAHVWSPMQVDSVHAVLHPVVVHWMATLFDGLAGGVAGGAMGWIAAVRVQRRAGRENRAAVVRRLLAATAGMIGDLRMAHQHLHNAEAQGDLNAVRAVFQGAAYVLSPQDGDLLAGAVDGGAEQLEQQCYQGWLAVETAAKEAATKYEQIRSLIALATPDADLTHQVGVYRGLLQAAITDFEGALRLTQPYAAPDSRPTLAQLLAGAA